MKTNNFFAEFFSHSVNFVVDIIVGICEIIAICINDTTEFAKFVFSEALPRGINLITGVGLGVFAIIPNEMMGDGEAYRAPQISTITVLASLLVIAGGIYGAITKKPYLTLIGIGLQMFTLNIFSEKPARQWRF